MMEPELLLDLGHFRAKAFGAFDGGRAVAAVGYRPLL
jgi:hypothetical protein